MIKPDRLKELIEQKATIYNKNKGSIKLDKSCYIDNSNVLCFYKIGIGHLGFDFIRNLFETEAEAEWALEFGNIVREEKLSLPSWEEFKENCNFPTIHCKNGKTANVTVSNSYLEIYKDSDDGYCEKKIYGKPLTKKNYIDACRFCKQLFLGEKE